MARVPKSKLSKNILEMKFMKRTKEKVEKEENEAEGRQMYEGKITSEMDEFGKKYIIEPSLAICQQLRFGRLSYNGMNTEIEKLNSKFDKKEDGKMDGISNTEMADRYSSLVGTIGKKFAKKRQVDSPSATPLNKRSKHKFIKPDY